MGQTTILYAFEVIQWEVYTSPMKYSCQNIKPNPSNEETIKKLILWDLPTSLDFKNIDITKNN